MTKKLIVGLIVLVAAAIFPYKTSSGSNSDKSEIVVLSSDNLIVLNSEVNGESTAAVITKAKELDAKLSGVKERVSGKKPLYVFLYTPGGSIQSGLEMIEALKGLGRPVHTVTLFAASMGWQIAQSLDDRLILKNGVMMSHHAMGQSEGEFGGSVKTQMQNRQELWDDRVRELDEQTVRRTKGKQTYESYTKQYDHEMWLTGTKSVDQGYSDKVVAVRCDASLNGATTHSVNFLGAIIQYDLDNCPINTSPMNVRIAMPDGKTISLEVSNVIKEKFLTSYLNQHKNAIPMYW